MATSGRRIIHGLVPIPIMLAELPRRLRDPVMLWSVTSFVLAAFSLVILGLGLQFATRRLESKLRARTAASEPQPWWRKVWLASLSVGLAAAPYVALLGLAGVVFSVLPVGAIPAGLAALVIFTFLLHRILHVVARVLLNPDQPNARLLPIDNSTAQQTWRWLSRLITLSVVYFLITRTLLTIGVAEAFYQVTRRIMIIAMASVLSAMLSRLGQMQHAADVAFEGDPRHSWSNVWATLRRIWPILTIAYLWCTVLLAILSVHYEGTSLVTTSLETALLIGAGIALLWGVDRIFNHTILLNECIERYVSGLERRTRRYLKALWWSSRALIVLVVFLSILQVWGVGIAWLITSPLGAGLLSRLIALLVTAGLVAFVVDLSTFISQKPVESSQLASSPAKNAKRWCPSWRPSSSMVRSLWAA
jgi:hypothetical protein